MASQLSKADVERLLKEPSPQVRAEVAGKLAQEIDNPRLTEGELGLAHDIVRIMARDIETSVRHALAENLRHAQRLPRDVALKLANDVETVALPILESSMVLTDEDLVSVVRNGSDRKHEAIAGRPHVSEQVSAALINTAGEKAIAVLMQNATAKITEESMDKAIDRFQTSETVKEAMVRRKVLPLTVAERLAALVSSRLQDYLVAHHAMSDTMAADLVLQSRERTVVSLASGGAEQDVEALVRQMHKNNRLTPSIVLRALCMGDLTFFEVALSVMANVPLVNTRILIHDKGRHGLQALYEKAGMPGRFLPAVRVALDVVHETAMEPGEHGVERYRARVIERVLTQFQDMNEEDITYLLAKLGDIMRAQVA